MSDIFLNLPEYDLPDLILSPQLSKEDLGKAIVRLKTALKTHDAVLIAHYYTHADIQAITDATGGCVADSLMMARFGNQHPASTLLVAGVRFMGETAKILNPEKRVLMPNLEATCSLDLTCPADLFTDFCAKHKDRTVVVYANTSAVVKAAADWVVTSSNAVKIIRHLDAEGHKILWASDRYLGQYIQKETGADMLIWPGSCVVHEKFKAAGIRQLKKIHPEAGILVHPESPADVIAMADRVGSTKQLLEAASTLPNKTFIVATDEGLLYKMGRICPDKTFIPAPTGGRGATCKSCARCPWMMMNSVELLERSLKIGQYEISLDKEIIKKAQIPLKRMIEFQE